MISVRDSPALAVSIPCGALAVAAALFAARAAAVGPDQGIRIEGVTMGTTYAVRAAALPAAIDERRVRTEIEQVVGEVDASMSTYRPDSELSRWNADDSLEWMPASRDLQFVVAEALEIARLSGGAFDPTVAPLVDLWSFGPRHVSRELPAPEEVARAARRVGWSSVTARAEPPALRKLRPGVRVDLSAIAKGFAVDRIAERLSALAVENFLVEIGGEVRAQGRRATGSPWLVAVQHPSADPERAATVLALGDIAVATSGDYRSYFEIDGVRYSHVIDPRSGRPVAHDLVSVSVIDRFAARADALATALLVLGPQDGPALAAQHSIAALFVCRDGDEFEALSSPGFARYVYQ